MTRRSLVVAALTGTKISHSYLLSTVRSPVSSSSSPHTERNQIEDHSPVFVGLWSVKKSDLSVSQGSRPRAQPDSRMSRLRELVELAHQQPLEDGELQQPLTEAAIARAEGLLSALRRESPELYARIGLFPEQDGGVELQLTTQNSQSVVTILRTGDIAGIKTRYPRDRVTHRFAGANEAATVAYLADLASDS